MNPLLTLLAVAILAGVTLAIVLILKLEHPWLQPWALARAVLQLAILSVILNGVISNGGWVVLFLFVMVGAATWVVYRRLSLTMGYIPVIALTIAVAAAIPTTLVFLSHAIEFSPRYVLAVGGIVIGNVMTVCTLMGRSLHSMLLATRDEVEAWLSVGATPRRAAQRAVRSAASTALIPTTDQTRTTGIVTLPGSFVGAVFAGASPLVAAQFQIIVLAAVLAAGAFAVASFTIVFGAPRVLPLELARR
jgi:putative ABC transport system permease protein